MEFIKYPSITNHYDTKEFDFWHNIYLKNHNIDLGEIDWDVTEKIHGSNMVAIYDVKEDKFMCGSRNRLLLFETDGFPNAVKKLEGIILPKMHQLKDILKEYFRDFKAVEEDDFQIMVYGEYFGGSYPEDLAPKDPQATRVQRGVFYSPSNHWAIFDIAIKINSINTVHYLEASYFWKVCTDLDLPTVPHIGTFKLDAAMELAIDKLDSAVPDKYNHLAPPAGTNIIEGVVLKPYDWDLWCGEHRIIIKYKNEKFREVAREQKKKEIADVPENVKTFLDAGYLEQYLTEQRLDNVISHLGRDVSIKDFSTICQDYVNDTLEDLSKLTEFTNLNKEETRIIKKELGKEAANKLRKYFTIKKE